MIQVLSISMAPWMLYSWVPVGLLAAFLEARVMTLCYYWEHGKRTQMQLTPSGFIFAALLGYVMLMRTLLLPVLLLMAYSDKRSRLADRTLPS
jgi:hypothetical protein